MTIILDQDDQALDNTNNKCDQRKNNIGSSTRTRYNAITKCKHNVACEEFMDEQRCNGQKPSVTGFVQAHYSENCQRYWKDMLSKWRKPNMKSKIIDGAGNELYRQCVTLPSGKQNNSPVAEMEKTLVERIKAHHRRGRKVLQRWICLTAKKIQFSLDLENQTKVSDWFKASRGWFHRLLKRHHIKFCKRKSGKKSSTDDNIDKILEWY